MDPRNPEKDIVRFGVFELDPRSGELRRHGMKIRLPPQSFQILRLLLNQPGTVVTREELRQALWTSDTFVDFDLGVNSAIRKLREALDDSAEHPKFVETLPRRGYRFIAQVEPPTVEPVKEEVEQVTEDEEQVKPEAQPASFRSRAVWIAAGLLLATTASAVVYLSGGFVGLRAGSAAPIRSLAVLPFENLTGDAAQGYFVDGVTEGLTTHLAQVDGLDVLSRTAARQYKQANNQLAAIGNEQKVDAVLQGAVARSGDVVRISAQLVRAATDRHVWARHYEGDVSQIFVLQQRIAADIAIAVGRRAAASPVARAPQTVNPRAYDAYLKGMTARGLLRYEGFRAAVVYFEEAVARQPDFAEAYSQLAICQLQLLYGGPLSPGEVIPKAEAAARKAVELDATLAMPHRMLGQILTLYYWRWDEGEKEFQRAAALSRRSNEPTEVAGELAGASFEGRGRSATVAAAERNRTQDPLSFPARVNLGMAYRSIGQHDRALIELRRALEMNPGNPRAHFQLGITYVELNRFDDAIRELGIAAGSPPGRNSRMEAYLGYAYAAAGRPFDARRVLRDLEARRREQYVSSFGIALIHDALGETAPALAALERAAEERAVEFAQMWQYPEFKTIASEPRFQAVMRQIGSPRAER